MCDCGTVDIIDELQDSRKQLLGEACCSPAVDELCSCQPTTLTPPEGVDANTRMVREAWAHGKNTTESHDSGIQQRKAL